MAKKVLLLLIALAVVAGAAGAFDLNIGLDPALTSGSSIDTTFSPGLSLSADFFPGKSGTFSLGPELNAILIPISKPDVTILMIPIALRLGWHHLFIKNENLDIYILGKFGWAPGMFVSGETDGVNNPAGVVYGFNIGAKYFFTPKLGAFLEAGYNHYGLTVGKKGGGIAFDPDLTSYGRVGVSLKF